ncbi:MAG: TonB-dependent receptor plug domain-containing protein [Pseudomonadota bacterium]
MQGLRDTGRRWRWPAWTLAPQGIALLALLYAPGTLAQSSNGDATTAPEPQGTKRYDRAFFNRFNPQTALDLLERLPGFTLRSGDEALRGFGGAAGNVLIDGERPSIKSGGIEDALRRIPANQVAQIEVIRGSAGLSEAAGQAVVANVIRRSGTNAGNWGTVLERAADGILYPGARITVTRQIGRWNTATKLNGFWERYPLAGLRVQRDADGALRSTQREDRPSVFTQGYLSTDADRELAGGTLTVTARVGRSHFLPDTERLGFQGRLPDGRPDERFEIDFDSIVAEGELGIDWTRPLAQGWSGKALTFLSVTQLDDEQVIETARPPGTVIRESVFALEQDGTELVLRGTLGRVDDAALKPEFGAEIAYNRQESMLSLVTREGTATTVIQLPGADAVVEETRGEVFANVIWSASEKLTVEAGMAVEASRIAVSGGADNAQSYVFAKPFATLIYDARPGLQLRLGGRRTVGQLDFSQFAASAEAADDRLLGGNPELGPDQTTRGTLTLDLRSEARGALNLELFHEWRDDVIEQVGLASGSFGAANAGDGRVWGVTATAALPLAPLLPGGLFELELDLRDSDFADPLSGRNRPLSNVRSPRVLAEFRQDLPARKLSWGFAWEASQDNRVFFADEESRSTNGGFWSVFVETTRFRGVRANLSLRNIGDRNFFRERRFFTPSRAGTFSGTETIDRDRGMFVRFTLEGQF